MTFNSYFHFPTVEWFCLHIYVHKFVSWSDSKKPCWSSLSSITFAWVFAFTAPTEIPVKIASRRRRFPIYLWQWTPINYTCNVRHSVCSTKRWTQLFMNKLEAKFQIQMATEGRCHENCTQTDAANCCRCLEITCTHESLFAVIFEFLWMIVGVSSSCHHHCCIPPFGRCMQRARIKPINVANISIR